MLLKAIIIIGLIFTYTDRAEALTAKEIMVKVDTRKVPDDIKSDMTMRLINRKGKERKRRIRVIRKGEEKQIMDFAVTSTFEIDDLTFQIWDCILEDNFSPLWYKFVADSAYLIINATAGTLTGDVEFILFGTNNGDCSGLNSIVGSSCGPSVLTDTISGLFVGETYFFTISSSTSSIWV